MIRIEGVNVFLSVLHVHRSVETTVIEASEVEVVGDDVQHLRHLAEDEHFVSLLLELDEHLVEDHHLAADVDDLFRGFIHLRLLVVDQEWVVADSTQEHHHVAELGGGGEHVFLIYGKLDHILLAQLVQPNNLDMRLSLQLIHFKLTRYMHQLN